MFMPRLIWAALFMVALVTAGCGSSSDTPTTPTTPVATTETFNGTLDKNGAVPHTFQTLASGAVQVTLSSVTPDSTIAVGMSLGTWNASSNLCQAVLSNDRAIQGTVIVGAVSGPGMLCVRMYDIGTLTQSETYVVDVSHP
jgi:hypothetical protein